MDWVAQAAGWAANLVVLTHLAFILFVVCGGLLALRWARAAWIHVPVALYGTLIELVGWTCPLTPLENHLRRRAGQGGYAGGFIEHYVLPIIYPGELTEAIQVAMGVAVLVVNVGIYWLVVRRHHRSR